jgi:amino acid adenylation domain-containing protein
MEELIHKLSRYNIDVDVRGDQLKLNIPEGMDAADIIQEVKTHKEALMAFIRKVRNSSEFKVITPCAKKAYYALSSAQKRLFFLHQFDSGSVAYHMSQIIHLQGELDAKKVGDVLNKLAERHDSLRTAFQVVEGEPVQKITDCVHIQLEYFQATDQEADEVIKAFVRPFDLGQAPLLRAGIIERATTDGGNNEHILMVDMHHIIGDGVSLNILVNEFSALYNNESLAPLRLQYKDYAEWQQAEEQQQELQPQRDFWLNLFREETIPLALPVDYARPAVQNHEGAYIDFTIGAEEVRKLKQLADATGATFFMALLAVYNVLLSKLSGQEDIVVGTPIAGRQHADLEQIMGVFVGTLPIRNQVMGTLTFRELLVAVKERTLTCFDNQAYPFEALINELKVKRDTSRNPLFDAFYLYVNARDANRKMPGLTGARTLNTGHQVAKFDCSLVAVEAGEQFHCMFEYSTALFRPTTVARFAEYFKQLINAVIAGADQPLQAIEIVPPGERHQLLHSFNDTAITYPHTESIVSLFEKQVLVTPESPAVVYGGEVWSYRALNEKADGIAARLVNVYNVQPGSMVGLLIDRGPWLLPALLGILKAGAAYIPIDPFYPAERIQYVLEDSGVQVVLTSPGIKTPDIDGVQYIDVTEVPVPTESGQTLPSLDASSPAYMIYTSGSTGKPKGVMINHRNVVNFINGVIQAVNYPPGGRMLCLTTVSFDIFVLETILPLLNGMTIVLAGTAEQKDPAALLQLIGEEKVDFLQGTPTHLRLLLDHEQGADIFAHLKLLFTGGEALPPALLKDLQSFCGGRIYNMYGPTETTVWSTIAELTNSAVIHIGKPITNTCIRILDRYGRLVPKGVWGELCIGGDGVSKGYWKREALTQEKFIADPYINDCIIYRTGDIAKWQDDGNIICGGRMDEQVKIRGHRIEPGEIEAVMSTYPGIEQAIVVARGEDEHKYLAAYFVTAAVIEPTLIRRYLADKLPEYMVPAYYAALESMPLTPSGKVDRKQLPAVGSSAQVRQAYVEARTALEATLVKIWETHLALEKIGIYDDFFELGGHSLLAFRIQLSIRKELGVEVSIKSLFQYTTIATLADSIGLIKDASSIETGEYDEIRL